MTLRDLHHTRGQSWQTKLRWALLREGSHKSNAIVRDFTAWLERPWMPIHVKISRSPIHEYPHWDELGPSIIIGPECFAKEDRTVISWRGENYYTSPSELIRFTPQELYALVYTAAGAATRPLLEDHPDYVFPSERVSEAVQYVIDEVVGVAPPFGYGGLREDESA